MAQHTLDLVVVGSVGLDDVDTPTGKVKDAVGGSAIYFALAARHFAQAGVVGVVGDDFPKSALSMLDEAGVDRRGLDIVDGKTFRWGGSYHANMNDRTTLFTELNVFEDFHPDLPRPYRQAKHLFLGNIHPSLQLDVLAQAEDASFVAMDTMNLWIDTTPEDLRKVLGRVDALLINDSEAQELAEEGNIVTAARAIHAMGPKLLVIKRGEYGALLSFDGRFFYAPAFPLDAVVDPTGAGDSFAGGFMGYLTAAPRIDFGSVCQAMIAGSAVASFNVEDFSVNRLLTMGPDALATRLGAFGELTHFPPLNLPSR